MKGARPLTKEEIERLRPLFTGKMGARNFALFFFGANTGYRISEILSLTLGDILDEQGKIKNNVAVARRHMKGNKAGRVVLLNAGAKRALTPWLKELADRGYVHKNNYIFQSHRGTNCPISRVHAWRVLNTVYRSAGLTGTIGTHGMRKTFANNVYNHFLHQAASGKPVDAFRATSKALGHADIKSTDQYLSFRTEEVDEAINAIEV